MVAFLTIAQLLLGCGVSVTQIRMNFVAKNANLQSPSLSTLSQPSLLTTPRSPWFPYPWVLLAGIAALLFTIVGFTTMNTTGDITLYIVGLVLESGVSIYPIIKAAKFRRWVWLIMLILAPGYSNLVFGAIGPTNPRVRLARHDAKSVTVIVTNQAEQETSHG